MKTWRTVDAFCVGFLLLLSALASLAPHRVPQWWLLVLANLAAAAMIDVSRRLAVRSRQRHWQLVFGSFPLLLFIWLWAEIGMLQQILFSGWFDQVLIDFEHAVIGVHLCVWVERFVSVPVTEWMMFGYFGYLPAIPLVGIVLFYAVRPAAMDEFLFAMALAYGICFLVFIIFPVKGPNYAFADLYTRDLTGYVFRWLTRLMEDYAHFPGGCFPSPHSAAGTVMLFMSYKYHRRTFWCILPVIGTFYLATVYGRYHYVSDTIAGVIVGLAVGWLTPKIEAWWKGVTAAGRRAGNYESCPPYGG